MYQSPIEIIHGELEMKLEGEVYKAVQRMGVNVDKEELLKALQYDRKQYKIGYEDGFAGGVYAFAERIKAEIANCSWQFSRLEAETIDNMAKEIKGE